MTVWIRFPELPVEYYDKQALFEIAKIVGTPIRVNHATDNLTRERYARVCLDIDLTKALITSVWLLINGNELNMKIFIHFASIAGKLGTQRISAPLKI